MSKKTQSTLLAITAAAALSFSAAAGAATGAYIQGDIGLGHLKVDDNEKLRVSNVGRKIKDSYHESGFMPRLSGGHAPGNGRDTGTTCRPAQARPISPRHTPSITIGLTLRRRCHGVMPP